jgi:Rrf2 family iron-sulfur cluster assembly transcriptional regulator
MQCLSHELWADLSDMIQGFLSGVTLQQIIDGRSVAKEVQLA